MEDDLLMSINNLIAPFGDENNTQLQLSTRGGVISYDPQSTSATASWECLIADCNTNRFAECYDSSLLRMLIEQLLSARASRWHLLVSKHFANDQLSGLCTAACFMGFRHSSSRGFTASQYTVQVQVLLGTSTTNVFDFSAIWNTTR